MKKSYAVQMELSYDDDTFKGPTFATAFEKFWKPANAASWWSMLYTIEDTSLVNPNPDHVLATQLDLRIRNEFANQIASDLGVTDTKSIVTAVAFSGAVWKRGSSGHHEPQGKVGIRINVVGQPQAIPWLMKLPAAGGGGAVQIYARCRWIELLTAISGVPVPPTSTNP